MSVSWGACLVPGSPFKVSVASGADPSKITVSGAGLSGGAIGHDLLFTIDTKRAGAGKMVELTGWKVSMLCLFTNKLSCCS